ncbi:MAG: hypothetical protein ACM3ZQ_00110 [Bacillota bacterium]
MNYADSLQRAEAFFQQVRRECCPTSLPPYQPRVSILESLVGEHGVPTPSLPYWWTTGVLQSPQLARLPWLKQVLVGVTYHELLEGRVSDERFKAHRSNWSVEQRKMISSPKIGGMLNLVFEEDPTFCARFKRAQRPAVRLPWWWFMAAFQSRNYAGREVANFLLKTSVNEFNTGQFDTARFSSLVNNPNCTKKPRSERIDEFLRSIFYEHPTVLTKFHQRGAKRSYRMRIATDPYSIITMSVRAKGWTSCQNPVQDNNHALSHRLWANLMDPYMAVMEMIDPDESDDNNLLARAVLRLVEVDKTPTLYLDFLYGERGYVSAFVSLTNQLAKNAGLKSASGRMIPFATHYTAPATGYRVNFTGFEQPYLDLGEWRRTGSEYQFSGEAHYLRA